MPQQVLGRRPPLLLHEDLLEEVAAGAGDAVGELGVGGLRGDLKNRRHGFELGPGRLLRQHLHHGAGHAPATRRQDHRGEETGEICPKMGVFFCPALTQD